MSPQSRFAVLQSEDVATDQERQLVALLQCAMLRREQLPASGIEFVLCWRDEQLSLMSLASNAPGALAIDFTAPALQHRALDGLTRQGLGKAIGLKKKPLPRILDATAGLGSDAFLLASAGCEVSMLERSGIVHALLDDALRRARAHTGSAVKATAERMVLQREDFLVAPFAADSFDVVYLDPMFPAEKKSARSGKGMYLLQELLGIDCMEEDMLVKARKVARKRVVVKRGKRSGFLAESRPDISFKGSSSRFDVYLQFASEGS